MLQSISVQVSSLKQYVNITWILLSLGLASENNFSSFMVISSFSILAMFISIYGLLLFVTIFEKVYIPVDLTLGTDILMFKDIILRLCIITFQIYWGKIEKYLWISTNKVLKGSYTRKNFLVIGPFKSLGEVLALRFFSLFLSLLHNITNVYISTALL